MPTRSNISAALRWLTDGARAGDVLFFHYSGHGAQQPDPNGYEDDGMNETIIPVDFKSAGMMTDDEISELIAHYLPEGVRLTAVLDCCHSGTGLDLPYTWNGYGWEQEVNPYLSRGDVQLFSGCQDDDTSADASNSAGAAGGAMTTAFCEVLRSWKQPTYPQIMEQLNFLLRQRGFSQRAQISSSQAFHFHRPFTLDSIIANSNETIGRIVRQRFAPRPRPMSSGFADFLGDFATVAGGFVVADAAVGLLGSFL